MGWAKSVTIVAIDIIVEQFLNLFAVLGCRVAGAALFGWSRSQPFWLELELIFWSGSGSYS